ncbi:MAG: CBS domain-containing protein [Planctomycetes bacterium]|nr:CBS domain-containing protein [Planctomycetota bacterium]MBI3846321.1 CBS domain-containing protein [Planctomycetota bacterium]
MKTARATQLKKKPLHARDVMSTDLLRITPNRTIREAASVMSEEGVSSLLVESFDKEEPFGIVTTKDLVDAVAKGADPEDTTVREVASIPLLTITPGVPLSYAARAMSRFGLRHLAIFNGREIVGVISNLDVVRAIADGRYRGED